MNRAVGRVGVMTALFGGGVVDERASEPGTLACPIDPTIEVIFGRWTTPILWTLSRHGRVRFNDLQQRVPSITAKVLTQRLRQLERDGLVVRTEHPGIPPKVE